MKIGNMELVTVTYGAGLGRRPPQEPTAQLLDSCQLTAKHKVTTRVNWKRGQEVIIVLVASDAEAKRTYPGGWKSPKPYIRIVLQPK